MEKKGILYVTHQTEMSGAGRSLIGLINRIKGTYEVHVLVRARGELSDRLESMNCHVIIKNYNLDVDTIDPNNKLSKYIWPEKVAKYKLFTRKINDSTIRSMSEYVKNNNIALVHSNSSETFVGAYIAKLAVVPHIWHFREFLTEDYDLNPLTGWTYFYKLASSARTVICVSDALREKYKDKIDTNVVTVRNAVEDPDLYGINGPDHDELNLLQVGPISTLKGTDVAIKAIINLKQNGHKNVHLYLAGSGNFSGLDSLLAEAGDQVHIISDAKDIYALRIEKKIDVEIVSSKSASFGRSLIEAMAMGLPVIATNKGGPREIVEHNQNGYLYEYGYHETLAEYIIRLKDRDLRKRMGDEGRKIYEKRFTMDRLADKVGAIYSEVLGE